MIFTSFPSHLQRKRFPQGIHSRIHQSMLWYVLSPKPSIHSGKEKKKEPQTQHKDAERQAWDRGLTSGSYRSKLICPISLKRTHGLYVQRCREKCNPSLHGQRPDQGQDCQGPVESWCSLNNEGMLTWTSMVTRCYWMWKEKRQEFWYTILFLPDAWWIYQVGTESWPQTPAKHHLLNKKTDWDRDTELWPV